MQRDIPAPTFAPPTFSGCTVSPKIVQAKIRGSANGSSMPSRPGSVMAGRAPCRSVHSENPRRGMAFGLACAFAQRSPSFGDRRDFPASRVGAGTLFSAPQARNASRRSHDLGVLCAKSGRDAGTNVCDESPSRSASSPDGRNRSYGTGRKVSSATRSNVAACAMLSGAMRLLVIATAHHP